MQAKILTLLLLVLTSCSRSQKETHTSINLGDSALVSISNLLINEIDTNIFANYKIEINHSSCLDSSRIPLIQYWSHDTTGKFIDREKSAIFKLSIIKCDSFILDKSKLNKNRLHTNDSIPNLKSIYSINLTKMLFNDKMNEAYTMLGTYFRAPNDTMIQGGWEEIVIFKKPDSEWIITKKLKIIKY